MIELYHDLSNWVVSFAESDWAIVLLALSSFVEAIFFPVPPDPLLVAVALAQPDIAIWLGALTAAASVAGAVVGYWLGAWLGRPLLLRMFSEDRIRYVESLFERYGVWATLAAAFTPDPVQGVRYRGRIDADGPEGLRTGLRDRARRQVRRTRRARHGLRRADRRPRRLQLRDYHPGDSRADHCGRPRLGDLAPARREAGRAMIVDSHAYCFPPLDAANGGDERLRRAQIAHASHHQPALRLRDRAPAPSRLLAPSGRLDAADLPDVDFRADREGGRVLWTVDGDDHTKYYYPPALRDLEYTPHQLVSDMDYAGVDVVLLHTDPMLERDGAFQAECVRAYPDRIRSMAPVDEWRIPSETDARHRGADGELRAARTARDKVHGPLRLHQRPAALGRRRLPPLLGGRGRAPRPRSSSAWAAARRTRGRTGRLSGNATSTSCASWRAGRKTTPTRCAA